MKKKGPAGKSRKKKSFWTKFVDSLVKYLFSVLAIISPFVCLRVVSSKTLNYANLMEGDVVGIDISHYQGTIEWDNLHFKPWSPVQALMPGVAEKNRPVDFVIAKSTEGGNHVDVKYLEYKKAATGKSIPFGAYHYFKPNVSPEIQARNFINAAHLKSGNILPVLDVEEIGRLSGSGLQSAVLKWLQYVEDHYGCTPILYCNLNYYSKYFTGPKFRKYPKWIAAYSRKTLFVDYALWQRTDAGAVEGIKGRVDIDVFRGPRNEFKDLLIR